MWQHVFPLFPCYHIWKFGLILKVFSERSDVTLITKKFVECNRVFLFISHQKQSNFIQTDYFRIVNYFKTVLKLPAQQFKIFWLLFNAKTWNYQVLLLKWFGVEMGFPFFHRYIMYPVMSSFRSCDDQFLSFLALDNSKNCLKILILTIFSLFKKKIPHIFLIKTQIQKILLNNARIMP